MIIWKLIQINIGTAQLPLDFYYTVFVKANFESWHLIEILNLV